MALPQASSCPAPSGDTERNKAWNSRGTDTHSDPADGVCDSPGTNLGCPSFLDLWQQQFVVHLEREPLQMPSHVDF